MSRKNQFGNLENQEAFDFIEKIWNNGFDNMSIYTLATIYHVNTIIPQELYKVVTEDGYILPEITAFKYFKRFFNNQLIVIVEENGISKWILPSYRITQRVNKDIVNMSLNQYRYPESSDRGVCTICLDPLLGRETVVLDNCGHMFHKRCIKKCTKNSCPNCRTPSNNQRLVSPVYVPKVNNFGKKLKQDLKKLKQDLKFLKNVC